MRLLYVIDSLAPGGAETSLVEMAPGLIARGIELHVLPLASRLDLAPALGRAGATVHPRSGPSNRLGNIGAVIQLGRTIRPDLIHTTLFESDVAGRLGARILGIPCSTSLVVDSYDSSHYAESNTLKLHAARAVDAITARFATRIHANSSAIARTVPPRLRLSSEIVDVIPRGRDRQRFPFQPHETQRATRKALGLNESRKVILAVGRMEPQKGFQYLFDAVPRIADAIPDAVVLLAGRDGRASNDLRSRAEGLPLDVRFLGHRTDIPALLATADVLVFPSEREGLPGTLIEALAVGTPIVASDIPPCLEVLGTDDELGNGLLTPVGDSLALAEAVIAVFADPEVTQQRTVSGRARFDALFTIDSVAARMADFFQRTAATTHRPSVRVARRDRIAKDLTA